MSFVGKRVRYIHEDTNNYRRGGYYPPIGTLGTVFWDADDGTIQVHWDFGTIGDGNWWCRITDVEVVEGEK